MILLKKYKFIKGVGNSMFPILISGDILFYKKRNKYRVNDIVIVKNKKSFITHRIIYKNKKTIYTKGDSNLAADNPVSEDNIIGKIFFIKRGNKILDINYLYQFQNKIYLNELIKINKVFKVKKIKYFFIKGFPYYYKYLNGKNNFFYKDCDILIKKTFLNKSTTILKELGFNQINKNLNFKNSDLSTDNLFVKKINNVLVNIELHTEINFLTSQFPFVNKYFYNTNLTNMLNSDFFKNLVYLNIKNEKFPILNKKNFIFYQLLHLFHHNFKPVYKIEFIKKFLNKKTINNIYKMSKKYCLSEIVNITIYILNTMYPIKKANIKKSFFYKFYGNQAKKSIMNYEKRYKAGLIRIINIFLFSEISFTKKIIFLFNKKIYATIFEILIRRINLIRKNNFFSF